MTEPPENTDADYYGDETFEEDSISSEVDEESPDHEADVTQYKKNAPTAYDTDSDTLSDSDVEAEFLKGNVSAAADVQELRIAEFSLPSNPNKTAYTHPQPYARRQQVYSGWLQSAGGFNPKRMQDYSSSSDEDETRVVLSKTVAEVNNLALHEGHTDDELSSVRTLKPGEKQQPDYIDDEELEFEPDDDDDVVLSDANEDERSLLDEHAIEEEEVVYENIDDELLLEEQSYGDDKQQQSELTNTVRLEAGSDSEHSVISFLDETQPVTPSPRRLANTEDIDTDMTLTPRGQRKRQKRLRMRPQITPRCQQRLMSQMMPIPEPTYTFDIRQSDDEGPPAPKLDAFLDKVKGGVETFSTRRKDAEIADAAAVKFLEQQMAQMSEMIMKSFRISGSASKPNVSEMSHSTDEADTASEFTESDQPQSVNERSSSAMEQTSAETMPTVRSVQLAGKQCRCPSSTELDEPSFFMDECGQGDGLMRYPTTEEHYQQQEEQQHFIPDLNVRISSMTPSSFNTENCAACHIDLKRPSSFTDKINYKNLGRKSFSFTNAQVREIERQNHILLKKMMTIKPTISGKPSGCHPVPKKKMPPPTTRTTTAAVNRKRFQRQIDIDNDVLKRKLEAIGSRRPLYK